LISNCIEECYKQVDIEASSLRLQPRYNTILFITTYAAATAPTTITVDFCFNMLHFTMLVIYKNAVITIIICDKINFVLK